MSNLGADASLKDELPLENQLSEKINIALLTKLPAAVRRTDSLHNRIYDCHECIETVLTFFAVF